MTFEVVYNKSLKIFSQLYVGVKPAKEGRIPLAFATPYEDNAAGRKRQDTVKGWVGNKEYVYDLVSRRSTTVEFTPDIRMLENTPRFGFKVTDEVKRVYYGGGNVVWRIEDPNGWEVEIQSNNLMALLQSVGVSAGGEINGTCIWARDGAHNVLLPVTSQEYKDAIKAAEGVKKPGKIPMKDRVIGRTYRLLDGTFGTYLGKHYVSTQEFNDRQSSDQQSQLSFTVPDLQNTYVVETEMTQNFIHKETEQFEGVYVDEVEMYPGQSYSYKKGGQTKYYKSAPLIAELDQKSFDVDTGVALANENFMVWASSGKNSMPCYAALVPHVRLKYDVKKITDEKFKDLRDKLLKEAKQAQATYEQQVVYWNENKYSDYPSKPKFLITPLLSSWGDGVLLQDGDKLYDSARWIDLQRSSQSYYSQNDQNESFGQDSKQVLLGRIFFTDYGYFTARPKQYHAASTRIRISADRLGPTTVALTKFETIDQMMAHVDQMQVESVIVEKFLVVKEDK